MKIVIDIDEDIYFSSRQNIKFTDEQIFNIDKAIYYGIILPEGHGDLIDRDVAFDVLSGLSFNSADLLMCVSTVIPADR